MVLPLFVIWYAVGLYALFLTVLEALCRVREGADLRGVLLTTIAPVLVGFSLFASWPVVAWAMSQSP